MNGTLKWALVAVGGYLAYRWWKQRKATAAAAIAAGQPSYGAAGDYSQAIAGPSSGVADLSQLQCASCGAGSTPTAPMPTTVSPSAISAAPAPSSYDYSVSPVAPSPSAVDLSQVEPAPQTTYYSTLGVIDLSFASGPAPSGGGTQTQDNSIAVAAGSLGGGTFSLF